VHPGVVVVTPTVRALQCLTAAYSAANPEHVRIKHNVEVGNGLPGIRTTGEVDAAIAKAGLEVRLLALAAQDVPACAVPEKRARSRALPLCRRSSASTTGIDDVRWPSE
jgi:hypothetical protein